jgi:hypothetical protein
MRWRFMMNVKTHEARRPAHSKKRKMMVVMVLMTAKTKATMILARSTIPTATALRAHMS